MKLDIQARISSDSDSPQKRSRSGIRFKVPKKEPIDDDYPEVSFFISVGIRYSYS